MLCTEKAMKHISSDTAICKTAVTVCDPAKITDATAVAAPKAAAPVIGSTFAGRCQSLPTRNNVKKSILKLIRKSTSP